MSRGLQGVRWLIRVLALLVFLPIFVPDPLLRRIGDARIVEHQLEKADAIVVLGGGVPFRPIEAARIYRNGLAPRVLIAAPPNRWDLENSRPEELDFTKPHHATAYQLLRQGGVPKSAIEVMPAPVTSTWEEASAIAEWVTERGGHRILIPTNQFHTRRVAWIFRRKVECDCRIRITEFMRAENWWESSDHVRMFQSEALKMLVYAIRYWSRERRDQEPLARPPDANL